MKTEQQSNNPDHIISRAHFRELTGLSRTSEWRLAQEGKLPAVVEIGGHKLGYLASSFEAWLQANSK